MAGLDNNWEFFRIENCFHSKSYSILIGRALVPIINRIFGYFRPVNETKQFAFAVDIFRSSSVEQVKVNVMDVTTLTDRIADVFEVWLNLTFLHSTDLGE